MKLTKEQEKIMDQITTEWADRGLLMEGGWQVYAALALAEAPESQKLRFPEVR